MCLVDTFEFSQGSRRGTSGYVLASKFSRDGDFIFAGGAGKNQVKVFTNDGDTSKSYEC
jgi:WD40 repeat protein